MKKNGHACRSAGFSLIELLVVMAILTVLVVGAILALKPSLILNKAKDSRRKSDLNKMRMAFEEYYNDKGSYPSYSDLTKWNVAENCDRQIEELSKYMDKWLCDPNGKPYMLISDNNWFKILTNLDNKNDKDIPDGWYDPNTSYTTAFARDEVNYGVSSPNILWYEGQNPLSICGSLCLKLNSSGCNDTAGMGCSAPDNCFLGTCTISSCKTTSCK